MSVIRSHQAELGEKMTDTRQTVTGHPKIVNRHAQNLRK